MKLIELVPIWESLEQQHRVYVSQDRRNGDFLVEAKIKVPGGLKGAIYRQQEQPTLAEVCAFRDEVVRHPRTRAQLAYVPAVFRPGEMGPKEEKLLEICRAEKARGRRVLVYSVYTGTRDTTARLKAQLDGAGFKVAVLRASVDASKREDWLFDQVDRGVDVLITNPELVKTGLDMLEFPTIVFMQSGYNVYTLQQAARRSWRIGQKSEVDVYFLGYEGSAQMTCLELMAKKIAVAQSTSGDMPESGLDVLNQGGESIEVALARQLVG